MSDLLEKFEQIEFAKVVFPRAKRVRNADLFEVDAINNKTRNRRPSIFLKFFYNTDQVLNQVFISQGKSGGDENAHAQGLAIQLSIGLQHGIPPQAFIKTLRGIEADARPYEEREEPYEEEDDRLITYLSIEDLIASKMCLHLVETGESISLDKIPPDKYSAPVLEAGREGPGGWKKLPFGDPKEPPLYLHLDENEDGFLIATFFDRGKSGGDESAHAESLGKLVSLSLQYGIHPYRVVESLQGISSPSTIVADKRMYQSIEDAVGVTILNWYAKRGIDLKESYERTRNKDEPDPISSLKLDLENLASAHSEATKEPCPNPECESTDYERMEKPGTRGCYILTCCGYEDGACR